MSSTPSIFFLSSLAVTNPDRTIFSLVNGHLKGNFKFKPVWQAVVCFVSHVMGLLFKSHSKRSLARLFFCVLFRRLYLLYNYEFLNIPFQHWQTYSSYLQNARTSVRFLIFMCASAPSFFLRSTTTPVPSLLSLIILEGGNQQSICVAANLHSPLTKEQGVATHGWVCIIVQIGRASCRERV